MAKFKGSRMPAGATGSMRVTHKDMIRVAWQGQRMKEGCATRTCWGSPEKRAASEILIYNLFLFKKNKPTVEVTEFIS